MCTFVCCAHTHTFALVWICELHRGLHVCMLECLCALSVCPCAHPCVLASAVLCLRLSVGSASNLLWISSALSIPGWAKRGSGEEKGNYAQWADSKLNMFMKGRRAYKGPVLPGARLEPRDRSPATESRRMGTARASVATGLSGKKNHFKIKLNAIKLAMCQGN